ncbi:endonuclease MutS2 [Paenibacillus tengchongensis]|uniref:endonuclease MutS2 n=1 Tax=Paenibacillus tengchongensis TaxID=2608684 RepID=UPI00124E7E5F|nr:DNA mismatch repair protein MutS [Paenibacillus tengchongensis]
MNVQQLDQLEYGVIKEELARYVVSYEGRRQVDELVPMIYPPAIQRALEETEEARELLDRGASVPIPSLEGMDVLMSLLGSGYLFSEQELTALTVFLGSCAQLRKYMSTKEQSSPRVASYAVSLQELKPLKEEIERCIRFGVIETHASKGLERARKKLAVAKERLQRKLDGLMARHRSILQENLVSMRGGRYVLPVKKEYYKLIKGAVLDQSTSGQTVYVEPDEIAALQGELELLAADEAREEHIILGMLSGLVEREQAALAGNIEVTGVYDFIFAKAKYARTLGARKAVLNDRGVLRMNGGRHPLLAGMIPVSLEFGRGYRSLIITGPNTGGKTVVLKTVGLLAAMHQSGMLIPAEEGSQFPVFTGIFSVIGDGQSLTQSLSTFSAQMRSIEGMLRQASPGVLLLIDELAAGTDPGEGFALSIAILEELNRRGANIIVTTHFNELKAFAAATAGFENARMEFDKNSLQPLYKLTIGEAGESYALQIAGRLGIPEAVIKRSGELIAGQRVDGGAGGAWQGTAQAPARYLDDRKEPGVNLPDNSQADKADVKDTTGSGSAAAKAAAPAFEIGDAVYVTSLGKSGIVYAKRDSMGMVGVMVQKHKLRINHKRLKPYLSKDELYPDDYDFDIIFESKENRKKRKLMSKRHVEGLTIIKDEDDN